VPSRVFRLVLQQVPLSEKPSLPPPASWAFFSLHEPTWLFSYAAWVFQHASSSSLFDPPPLFTTFFLDNLKTVYHSPSHGPPASPTPNCNLWIAHFSSSFADAFWHLKVLSSLSPPRYFPHALGDLPFASFSSLGPKDVGVPRVPLKVGMSVVYFFFFPSVFFSKPCGNCSCQGYKKEPARL